MITRDDIENARCAGSIDKIAYALDQLCQNILSERDAAISSYRMELAAVKELSDLRLRDLTECQRKLLKAEKLAAMVWLEKESK